MKIYVITLDDKMEIEVLPYAFLTKKEAEDEIEEYDEATIHEVEV